MTQLTEVPFLGVGLGFRQELKDDILQHASSVDFLELMTEQYMDMPPHKEAEARELSARIPLVLHGVELSIATYGDVDLRHVAKMKAVAGWSRAHWVSDHLCLTRVSGRAIGNLTPVAFSHANCDNVVENVRTVAAHFDLPFLLENISYYFEVPPREMSEADFIRRVLEEADCHLLLDLTNVQNNAINNSYDPYEFIDRLPLDRIVQIHLAGGMYMGGLLLDTHSHAVPDDVFDLLRYTVPRAPNLRGVIVERDQNFPSFAELLHELEQIREIVRTHRRQAW